MTQIKVKLKDKKKLDVNNTQEEYRHYVNRSDLRKAIAQDELIVALCGKKWKPSFKNQNLPICPKCKEFYSFLDHD